MAKKCCCKNGESCEGLYVEQGCCYIPNSTPRESWANITRDYTGAPFQSSPIGGTVDGLIRTQLTSCGGGADWGGNWYDETTGTGGQWQGPNPSGLGLAYGDQSKDSDGKKCQTICVSACTKLEEFIISVNDTDGSINECVEVEPGSYDTVRFGTSQADWTLTTLPNGNEFWCPNIENTFIQFVIEDKQNFCFKWTQHDAVGNSGSTSFYQAVYHDKVTKFVHTCTGETYYETAEGDQITELPEGSVCEKIECHGIPSPEPCVKQLVYRYAPASEPGLNVRFWDNTHGPHLDPLSWAGPADVNGFPLPTANPPDLVGINNSTNINDSNSGQVGARYGIIDGWIYLPEGTTNLRDNNGNTGEYGMVLTAKCCSSVLTEQAGGNHTVNTSGQDRTLMDSVPASEGWLYIYNPQSDLSAANGLDLEYSVNGGTTWINVPTKRPDTPVVECMEISSCDPIPEGWQLKPLKECCEAVYIAPGGLSADQVIDLVGDHVEPSDDIPVPDNDVDNAIRTGSAGVSDEYSRADHNHPIVRQSNPGDPVPVYGGSGTLDASLILDRLSTEESYMYKHRLLVSQPAGTGWGFITMPSIAGFQQPKITGIGTYLLGSIPVQVDDSVQGASPRPPLMGKNAHEWSSTRRVYMGFFRRDNAHRTYVEFWIEYIRT